MESWSGRTRAGPRVACSEPPVRVDRGRLRGNMTINSANIRKKVVLNTLCVLYPKTKRMPRSTAAALLYLLVAVSCGETESSEVVMPSGSGESSSGESDESDDGNSPSLGATYVDSYADPDELPWMWSESETDNSYWSYGAEWSYEYDPLEALGFVPEFSGEPSWQSRAIHVQVPAATSAATELRRLLLRRSSPWQCAHIHAHAS